MTSTARGIILTVLFVLLLFFAIRAGMQTFAVEGPSMLPNLQDGQVVLVNKGVYWFHEPRRGDIVVYDSGGKRIIHRVVGLPGEYVEVNAGKVKINGVVLNEPYAHGNSTSWHPGAPQQVPDGQYFIIGDNRNGTLCEMVPGGNIIGKAWLCLWPLGDLGGAPNYGPYALKPSEA
jgi:signal peptidase I